LAYVAEEIEDEKGCHMLSMLLRIYHGLLGAHAAAENAGVLVELEHEIEAFKLRGQRLEETLDRGGLEAKSVWVSSDLMALMNAMARFASLCALKSVDEDSQSAKVMSTFLCEILYDHLGGVAEQCGFFKLDRVLPLQSVFEAKRHQALGSKVLAGHVGQVLEIVRVGVLELNGDLSEPAQVIAGR